MIWNRYLHALIPDNPMIIRELRNQQRSISFLMRWIESVMIVAVALCVSAGMVTWILYHAHPFTWRQYFVGVQFLAWGFHAIVIVRFLAAGGSVVERDNSLLSSDEVFLTPLSNRQIIFGKWWAAMH